MSPRSSLVPLLLLSVAASAQAGPAEDLARLIKQSAANGQPVMTFFTGARAMPDVTLDRASIQRALQLADVPVEGPLARVLAKTHRLVKRGDRIQIDRSERTIVRLGEKGLARLGRSVSFRVRGGKASQGGEHVRGADPGTGYVKVDKMKGIEVSEDGAWFYDMGDLYAFTRKGRPTIKFYAGPPIFGKWITHSFKPKPKPAAPAPAAGGAVVDPKYGLAALPLREGPGASHALIEKLAKGTAVEVLSKDGDPFWKVKANGKVGYVHKDHLKVGGVGIANRIPGQ